MTLRREVNLAALPALAPMFGGLDKKLRLLDKDVITVGRARGCDIGLMAPDVSTLHCILYRTPEGFRVRDCGSRTGTRLNGEIARQPLLADGDILQIGPFSFAVKVPPAYHPDQQKPDAYKANHWERSRRNLARLAVALRRKLRHATSKPDREAELDRKSAELRSRIRQYDERLNQLEQAERDLSDDRDLLRRDQEAHQVHVQKIENDIARRLEQTDQEIHARWQEFQQRCNGEQSRLTLVIKEADASAARCRKELDELDRRRRELDEQVARFSEEKEKWLTESELAAREVEQEKSTAQARREELERELQQRRLQLEQEIADHWQQFTERCQVEEQRLAERAKRAAEPPPPPASPPVSDEERRELEELAAALRRQQEQLAVEQLQLNQGVEDLQSEQQEIVHMREHLAAERRDTSDLMERQRAALSEAEGALREQRCELGRMMGDLRQLQETMKRQQGADVEALALENNELRRRLAKTEELQRADVEALTLENDKLRRLLAETEQQQGADVEALTLENNKLHGLLAETEQRLIEAAQTSSQPAAVASNKEFDQLHAENALLHKLLEERDQVVEELRQSLSARQTVATSKPENIDLESYEAELNQYRQQLEADRAKVNTEFEQLRLRNAELDDATREMEMEMSKERAELARERIRLDRLREEVRSEIERMQRDASMRDSLAPVQKLRGELNQKKGVPPAPQNEGNRVSDRLKSLNKRLGDPT